MMAFNLGLVQHAVTLEKYTLLHSIEKSINLAHLEREPKKPLKNGQIESFFPKSPLKTEIRNRKSSCFQASLSRLNDPFVKTHCVRSSRVCTRACISFTIGIARASAFCSVWPA